MTTRADRAAIYCRISQDPEGEELGVERQHKDCRELAERRGLDVVDVFTDNDIGASTRSKPKPRHEYERMLNDARAGRFGVILSYSNSRITRRPLELEGLITLHEHYGTRIKTVVSGSDNLSTADGRMVARIKASVDAAEVERLAERVARKHLENALKGKPVGGTRPFGWRKDKATIKPIEATLIRQAAEDIRNGVAVRRVVNAWNAAGVKTSRGGTWSHQTMRQMLKSPRLVGLRVHQGEVIHDHDGNPVRGQWEPILDHATHAAVVARLSTPERRVRVPRRGGRHYLLSGLIRCGICAGPMYGNRASKQPFAYRCERGHNGINGPKTDAIIEKVVIARLAAEDLDAPEPEPFGGEAQIAAIGDQIKELMDAFKARRLSGAIVIPAVEELEAERAELVAIRNRHEARLGGPDVMRITLEEWVEMDTDRRRAVVETVVETVVIHSPSRRGNVFDDTRVVWGKR